MIRKETLPNGVRILTEEIPYVYSAAAGIFILSGSRDEQPEVYGVSHFLEHLLFKGTKTRTAKQIAEELDGVGGVLNAFTTKEYTCFYAKVLAEHLDLAVDVLTDMFFNSLMDEHDIRREKKVILEEIMMYEDSPDELIHDLFASTVWNGHPLGRPVLGSQETIRKMKREDIVRYFLKNYTADKIIITVTGKINSDKVVRDLGNIFKSLPRLKEPRAEDLPTFHSKVCFKVKNTEQVQLCMGTPGLSQKDEEIYTLYILNTILGGGISSRLFQEIREEKGLVYSIFSYHATYLDSGLFTVYAGTSPGNVQKVIEMILKEISLIKKESISKEELERAKNQIKGNLMLGMENVANRMSRLAKNEFNFGRVVTIEETLSNISGVTPVMVQELANKLLVPRLFSLSAIGPTETIKFDFQQLLKTARV